MTKAVQKVYPTVAILGFTLKFGKEVKTNSAVNLSLIHI